MNTTIRYEPTGEVRPPRAGEWFQGYDGAIDQAQFDFSCQEFPIFEMVLAPAPPDPSEGP